MGLYMRNFGATLLTSYFQRFCIYFGCFFKRMASLLSLHFPIFVGQEPVQITNKKSKQASLSDQNYFETIQMSWTLDIAQPGSWIWSPQPFGFKRATKATGSFYNSYKPLKYLSTILSNRINLCQYLPYYTWFICKFN